MKDEIDINWDQKTQEEEKLRKKNAKLKKEKNKALRKENDYLDFRRRIINEVTDKIFCFFAIVCFVSFIVLLLFLIGYRPNDEPPPSAIIFKQVFGYLVSLPIVIQLLIIVFVLSGAIMIALSYCSVEKGEVIVLGKEHDW